MLLTVRGKQIDVGDALRAHAAESLNAVFAKYFGDPVEATVMLSREAHLYRAQISVHVGRGILLQSQADADAPEAAGGAKGEGSGQPVIVAELAMEIPTLSVGEAVMRLDLADGGAIMFRNRAHGGLNMVYRRARRQGGRGGPPAHPPP